jgi:hypothetical protein
VAAVELDGDFVALARGEIAHSHTRAPAAVADRRALEVRERACSRASKRAGGASPRSRLVIPRRLRDG